MKASKRTMTTNNFDPLFESNLSSSIKSTKSQGDKHRSKHKDYFDCLNENILSMNSNNNNSVVQQDIGDYSRDKNLHQDNLEQWRFLIYLFLIIVISFVLYRCSNFLWMKPRKTFLEQCLENFSRLFTL